MKTRTLKFFAFLALLSPVSFAQEEESSKPQLTDEERAEKAREVVALARGYLGDGDKLDAVDTLRMEGVLIMGSGTSGTVESIFKKPEYHQVISILGGNKETSTLNRSEAWQKMEKLQTPNSYSMSFYETDDILHLQATVLDTLSFLDTPPTRNGRIEYLGTAEVDGEPAEVLGYAHSEQIWFRRYIDPETGRVMHMVNDKGVIYSYEGVIEVDGIKFPEKTIVRILTQFGEQTMEVSFSKIHLNEDISVDRFRVPGVGD